MSETLVPSSYKTSEWPIIISEFEQTHTEDENNKRKGLNDLSFQLKFKTENKKISLYNTRGNSSSEAIEGLFLGSKALINEENISTQESVSYTHLTLPTKA